MSSSQELYNRLNEKLRELVSVKNGKQVTNWIWIMGAPVVSNKKRLSAIFLCPFADLFRTTFPEIRGEPVQTR